MAASTTVILGGGFGGLTVANSLRPLVDREHRILVVDAAPKFHVGAAKTWVMLGERTAEQISHDRSALRRRGIEFLQQQATRIDLAAKTVEVGPNAVKLAADYLVIALGAAYDMGVVDGLKESAETFYTLEGAERLNGVLKKFNGGDVVILIPRSPFKCPPAPYEAAMLLQNYFQKRGIGEKTKVTVCTLEGAPMATAGPEVGRFVVQSLTERGVAFQPLKKTKSVDGTRKVILFEDGSEIRYDLLIAIPPHVPPAVIKESGLSGPAGWIPVDPKSLAIKADASGKSFAIGDVAGVPLPGRFKPDAPLVLPKAGVFAEAHGKVVGANIAAMILGKAPTAEFPGKGYCYIEMGDKHAARGDGSFFDLPHPTMVHRIPDLMQYEEKLEWVKRWPAENL